MSGGKGVLREMKRIVSILLAAVMAAGLFAACGASSAPESSSAASVSSAAPSSVSSSEAEPELTGATVRLASLKGPTTMGIVKMLKDSENGETANTYESEIYGSAEEISPKLISGELDAAFVPCNLASVLYNKTEGQVEIAAINTLGVLYIVTTGDGITSVADLAGKTIYATGKGTTPEYALNYILRENGLEPGTDVTIDYKSEATEVLAAMQADSGYPIAMLPQPYVTTAQMQMESLNVALDLTEEWDKVSPDSALVTGVLVVRKDFAEANPDAVELMIQEYNASVEYVNANVEEAAKLVVEYGIVPKEEVAVKAIPACNIVCIAGSQMKAKASGYLNVLFEQDAASDGGALPADDFYYGA